MKRATVLLVAAGVLLAAGPARGDQTWTQNQHATNQATGVHYTLDGLSSPLLRTSALILGDMPGAGLPCAIVYTGTLGSLFRCATPADIPGATGTPNTVAWFNGSGLLNSLILAPELALNAGTGTLGMAAMPARSFKVNATNASGAPANLACTGAGQVPQDTGTALVCQQLAYSSLAGIPANLTALHSDVVAAGPGDAAATIQPNVVTNAKLAQAPALTVKVNATNATANEQDLSCPTAGTFLGNLGGTSLACSAVPAGSIAGVANTVPFFNGAGTLAEATNALGYDPATVRLGSRISSGLPLYQLHLIDEAGAADSGIVLGRHFSGNGNGLLAFQRSEGSYASPAIVGNSDYGGRVGWDFYDGSTYLRTAQVGTHVTLGTTPAAGNVQTDWYVGVNRAGITDPYAVTSNTLPLRIVSVPASPGTVMIGSRVTSVPTNFMTLAVTGNAVFTTGTPATVGTLGLGNWEYQGTTVALMGLNSELRFAGRAKTTVVPGDNLGITRWYGWDGASFIRAIAAEAWVDYSGTVSTGSVQGAWGVFYPDEQRAPMLAVIHDYDVLLGDWAPKAATDTLGFVWLPTMAGAPVGAPTQKTFSLVTSAHAAIQIDSTDKRLYARLGGAWVPLAQSMVGAGTGYLKNNTSTGLWTVSATVPWADVSGAPTFLLDPGGNGMVSRTAAGVTVNRTISPGTGIGVANGDGVAGNPTITNTSPLSSLTASDGTLVIAGTDIRRAAIGGDGTINAGSNTLTLTNIPSGTTAAGTVNFTPVALPATPGSGHALAWVDSTAGTLAVLTSAAVLSHTARSITCPSSQWLRQLFNDGSWTCSQPLYSDISGAPSTLPPSGPAGGALTGSYPNPSIAAGVIIGTNFAAFPANTLFGNPTGSSAAPTTIPLGTGLAFSGGALGVTIAAGAPAAATYWISSAASAPSNGVRMDLLGNGVIQQTVAGGVSTPTAFNAPPGAIFHGSPGGSTLGADTTFQINDATHTLTAGGTANFTGSVVIGSTTAIVKRVAGLISDATAGDLAGALGMPPAGYVVISSGPTAAPTGDPTLTVDTGLHLLRLDHGYIGGVDGSGYGLLFNRSGPQILGKVGGPIAFGTGDSNTVDIRTNGVTRMLFDTSGGVTVPNLAGTGTRCVQADPSGVLSTIAGACGSGGTTYTFSTGLTNSSGTVTVNLSTGVSGGQSTIGGTSSGDALTLRSNTSNNGKINLGLAGGVAVFDEASGKSSFGQVSVDGQVHVAVSNDTAPVAVTAWDSRHFVVGASGGTAGGFGVSTTSGTSTVNLTALAPNTAWWNMRVDANSFAVYGGGVNLGLSQDSAGNVSVATLNAGGVVVSAPGTGKLSVSPALIASLYYTTRLYTLLNGGELVQGGYSLNPFGGIGTTQVEYPVNIAASHVTLSCKYTQATVTSGAYVFRPARNGVDTSIGVSITPGTTTGTYTTSTTVSSPATSDTWGLDVTSVGTANNCDPSTSNCPDILCSILLTP